jgi:hypothetical protein
MIKLVKATTATAQPDYRLALRFSDGSSGVVDLRPFVFGGGAVVAPLRDPAFFAQVFIEMGVPTWPNGCDIDPTNARMELEAAGALTVEGVAA